ncbi:hypothetical protein GCM10007420_24940 [Glycocaulis albus]|uniref:DUF3137 domain-containing protein n=1 Tax=Glycocaulis albus TaxID=1382801 RepID=A0ABQ1XZI5_9PROT|nr:DUF3137 domain-containing protein [Glycocaulis albus]GGH07260.1 hypothetical protein GCM10007420_24940 [Glycocaulis albus]
MRNFDAIWAELEPWLEGLESRRKAAARRLVLGSVGGIAAGLVVIALGFAVGVPFPFTMMGGVITAFSIAAIAGVPFYKLRDEVKHGLNDRLADAFSLRYAPKPDSPAHFDSFRSHGLIPHSHKRAFEDHFSGEAHGAEFELYEAELKQRRRSKKRTYYVTVFRGVLIGIAFPRTIEGVTLITRDQGIFNALDGLTRSARGRKLERIGLVDPKFERIFQVYGTDQVMARYLMTPTFMERVLALETALKGKNVRGVFDEGLAEGFGKGELLLAAETGNLFEPGSLFKPLNVRDRVERLYRDFELVEQIIALVLEPDEKPEWMA